MNIKINVYRAEPDGDDDIRLYISLSDGEMREDKEFVLSVSQYFELGKPRGEISTDLYGKIEEAEQVRRAIKKGMGILLYGDNTADRLKWKLIAAGYSGDAATNAVKYLRDLGFINEDKIARQLLQASIKKGYGPMRINMELQKKGVPKEIARDLMKDLDVDFVEQCALVIKKKWGEMPSERAARAKAVRALTSLGYTYDDINSAVNRE